MTTLTGTDSSDTWLTPAENVTSVDGKHGSDFIDFSEWTHGIAKSLQFLNMEYITGTQFSDTIKGDAGNNNIEGGQGGGDVLYGMDGNDQLYASRLSDDPSKSTNNHATPYINTLYGGNGTDRLNFTNGPATMYGGNGHDTFVVDANPDDYTGYWAGNVPDGKMQILDFCHGMDKLDTVGKDIKIINNGGGNYEVLSQLMITQTVVYGDDGMGNELTRDETDAEKVDISVHCTTPAGITLADII